MNKLTGRDLDAILALQLTVAWAGETPRLGWWKCDVLDANAGGDFLARLVPQTAAWAGLELAREAARRVDEIARKRLAGGDGVWTLFHFGYDVNEQLDERLAEHKRARGLPQEKLGARFLAGNLWSVEEFVATIGVCRPQVEITPAGRRLTFILGQSPAVASALAAALVPIAAAYPMPYVERA